MQERVIQPEISALVETRDFAALKAALIELEIHDLAELLAELEGDDLAVCFRFLTQERAVDILAELESEQQEKLLGTLSSERVAAILNEMPPDDRTELLEELPGELAQRLLVSLQGDELKIARSLLAYPEDSVGRLMTPEYVAVNRDWTVVRVFEHLRKVGREKETLNVIYVTNEHWRLLGEVRLEQLVLADHTQLVEEIMEEQVRALAAADDRETAVEIFRKYDAVALPAINSQGILVGIVTVDDVMDVAEEEVTEDFQKMAGMQPLEYSYFGTGYLKMMRKRLPWLGLLLVGQLLTTVALIGFHSLPLFVVLVMFMPLINSPAGNTGSQMAGLMIRGLAVREIDLGDWSRVLLRELARGLSLGVILGVLGGLAALLFARAVDTGPYPPHHIAASVTCAMLIAVTLANLLGAMLPFVFKRLGLDPAVTSAPFIASLMDVSGIVIYFSIATAVFAGMG